MGIWLVNCSQKVKKSFKITFSVTPNLVLMFFYDKYTKHWTQNFTCGYKWSK